MDNNLFCTLCNQGPMARNQYEQHCNGKNHKKKLYLNGGSMQIDLPDDRRSTKFYSSAVVEQRTVVIFDDSDDDDDFGYNVGPEPSRGPPSPQGEDFPALGRPSAQAAPAAASVAQQPVPPTAPMAGLSLGRGRGVGRGRATNSASPEKPTVGAGTVAPAPRSWSNVAQVGAPAATPWSGAASTASTPSVPEQRPLTQSERSGNVRVIRQNDTPATVPAPGNRPIANYQKFITAKRVFGEYKKNTKNASQALQEIATSLQWILEEEEVMPDSTTCKNFAMRWKVDGVPCPKGQGQKKKLAKEEASRLVLRKYSRYIETQGELDPDDIEATVRPSGDDSKQRLRNVADDYKRLAMAKIDEIVRESKGHLERPVRFAAFFITTSATQPAIDSQLVALGTGRCVSKFTHDQALSSCGYVLHDMQAPVIAKRAFQAFLYGQLSQAINPIRVIGALKYGETIIEYNEQTGRFRLKPGVRVHLYMSHAPAGDATSYDSAVTSDADLTDAELARDLAGILEPVDPDSAKGTGRLRVVVDPYRDETAILAESRNERFPGQKTIVRDASAERKQKLLVMSQADKLMKWNHVGLQGSLLSLFLDPVYLYSIQMGSGYSHGHAVRALLTRVPLSVFPDLPPYYNNADDPFIGRTTQVARLRNQIEGPVSINWFQGTKEAEVVNCDEGKLTDECSRLSRVTMLMRLDTRWNECFETGSVNHPGLTRRLRTFDSNVKRVSYGELKSFADDYQRAKATLYNAIHSSNLGHWIPKEDLQAFCLRDYEEEEEEEEEEED